MSNLVIVESPGKIKKIKSFLGSDYIVMASVGHICDLSKDSNAIDYDNRFNPTYQIMPDKKTVVNNLKNASKNIKNIYIASDGDREGEAIAYHLITELKLKNYSRIVFNEITKNAINRALQNPRLVDYNMFYSQQTRRILDRIVGYKISPILKSIPNVKSNSLGAGRVQSVVTRLIVDKENEINSILDGKSSSHYNINGDFSINKIKIKLNHIYHKLEIESANTNSKSYNMVRSNVESKDEIKIILINIKADPQFIIDSVNTNQRMRHPPQPFITSTLQQEASYKLKFQLKKTMSLSQRLYEKGLITYMRTDSPTLSNEALNTIKNYIINTSNLGEQYYQFRQFKSKNASAQEAHEAIRPTHIDVFKLDSYNLSNTDEEKLYMLIWNRTIASQMKPAKYDDQHIVIKNSKDVKFDGTNSILIFDGYLKLYNDSDDSEKEIESKHIKLNSDLSLNTVEWTKIYFKETYGSTPVRYNEPSLVKKLESLGIGRPSTYASIISKIQEHKYIEVKNIVGIEKKVNTYTLSYPGIKLDKSTTMQKIGNEKLKLVPTEDGKLITDFLINNFHQIMDYKFTAHMETLLDDIASGNRIWYEVLSEFYDVLKEQLSKFTVTENVPKSNSNSNNTNTNIVVGKHRKYGEIIYMNAKYGPVFKYKLKNKDQFVNAKGVKTDSPSLYDTAIKYIDYKVNRKVAEV
jgi:DNA topoisomerase-1